MTLAKIMTKPNASESLPELERVRTQDEVRIMAAMKIFRNSKMPETNVSPLFM